MASGEAHGSMAPMPDEEREALDREFRAHWRWLAALARRRLGSSPDADDVVQEAFVRAARYPEARRERPRPLLARILLNLVRDRARGSARERAANARFADLTSDGSVAAEQHEQLELKRIILGMPEPLRDVFLLARFTALSQAEIAERLGVSVKTVEWRLRKALSYCAERLAG